MKVKVLAKADESMRLLLEETEPAYANSLRRVLVSDVPKMAIEDVEFHLGPIRADAGKEYESADPLRKRGTKSLEARDPSPSFCESHMQFTSTEKEETLILSSDCETCKKFMDQYKVESVKAANDPTRIVMEFETDGSLSAKAVLLASLDILAKRFSELATQASALA